MNYLTVNQWQIAGGILAVLLLGSVAAWLLLRRRPTEDELEAQRRTFLVQSGRLVDGMLLDLYDVEAVDGRTRHMLLFNYRIAGVDYECSQDVTMLADQLNPEEIRVGFPCSVRYQPGNSQNSIVVAENWSGLRAGLPVLPAFDDPDPLDRSYIRRRKNPRS